MRMGGEARPRCGCLGEDVECGQLPVFSTVSESMIMPRSALLRLDRDVSDAAQYQSRTPVNISCLTCRSATPGSGQGACSSGAVREVAGAAAGEDDWSAERHVVGAERAGCARTTAAAGCRCGGRAPASGGRVMSVGTASAGGGRRRAGRAAGSPQGVLALRGARGDQPQQVLDDLVAVHLGGVDQDAAGGHRQRRAWRGRSRGRRGGEVGLGGVDGGRRVVGLGVARRRGRPLTAVR